MRLHAQHRAEVQALDIVVCAGRVFKVVGSQ